MGRGTHGALGWAILVDNFERWQNRQRRQLLATLCDVTSVVCDVTSVVCDVTSVVCDVTSVVLRLWCVMLRVWCYE